MQQQLPSATFHFPAEAKKGADHTNKLCQGTTSSLTTLTTRCADGTPSLQALPGESARASQAGQSCLAALFSLVISQESE